MKQLILPALTALVFILAMVPLTIRQAKTASVDNVYAGAANIRAVKDAGLIWEELNQQ